jgi:DNA-binding PadR family transcriptional regulator
MLVRLLVLWLLAEQPMHGYGIKRALTDGALRLWFSVEDASIYSLLRTLVKQGHAQAVGVEREGDRPERTLYAITPQGRTHYADLLERACAEPDSAGSPIQAALAALPDIADERLRRALRARRRALRERLAECRRQRAAAPDPAMADRTLALTRAELAWLAAYARESGFSLEGDADEQSRKDSSPARR